jgi:hypothetical protein
MPDISSTLWADDVSSICPSLEELFVDIADVFTAVTAPVISVKSGTKQTPKTSKVYLIVGC